MKSVVRLRACAKINLILRVGPRRPDGYHDIATLFQSISLADELTIRRGPLAAAPGLHITTDDPSVPTDDRNTIFRAFLYLLERHPRVMDSSFRVSLRKKIPHGTGLGGASADAAAFLIGASQLLGLRPPRSNREMSEVAEEIGADVPFCLTGGTAVGRGLGERLTAARPLPACRIFIVVPAARISTADAYRALDRMSASRVSQNLTKSLSAHSLKLVVDGIDSRESRCSRNDFEAPAFRQEPKLKHLSEELATLGFSGMTGSGSAFYVIPKSGVTKRDIAAAAGAADVFEARFVRRAIWAAR